MLARQGAVIGAVAHRVEQLGGGHDLLAARCEIADGAAEHRLALAERIDIGRVEKGDTALERRLDEGPAGVFIEHPVAPGRRAIGHADEAETRYFTDGDRKSVV